MKGIKNVLRIFKRAASEFIDDNAIKLSASLSYYTIFSIGPMIIVIISFAGIFFGQDAIQGKIYRQIKGLIGSDASLQVQQIIVNIQRTQHTVAGAIIGIIALLIGATGVFTEIQGSINYIWSVRAKPKKGWIKFITNRLI